MNYLFLNSRNLALPYHVAALCVLLVLVAAARLTVVAQEALVVVIDSAVVVRGRGRKRGCRSGLHCRKVRFVLEVVRFRS